VFSKHKQDAWAVSDCSTCQSWYGNQCKLSIGYTHAVCTLSGLTHTYSYKPYQGCLLP